jgi:hypothetical protein
MAEAMMNVSFNRLFAPRGRKAAFGLIAAWLAVSAVASARAAADNDTPLYRVKIVQPFKTGDQVRMKRDIDVSIQVKTTVDKVDRTHSSALSIKFFGGLEALEVDSRGQPTRWEVVADIASVRKDEKAREELVKPGTELIAQWNGGKVAVSAKEGGQPLSDDAVTFLPLVFQAAGGTGEMTLAAVLDPASPQSVGASWKIDSKAAVDDLHEFDATLKPSDILGTVHLKSAAADADNKTLEVAYEFSAKSKTASDPPEGMKPLSSTREETGSLIIPADLSTGYASGKVAIRLGSKFKRSEPERTEAKTKYGRTTKTIWHEHNVEEDESINRSITINTQLTYERFGGVERKSSSTPSKATPPSSSHAAGAVPSSS